MKTALVLVVLFLMFGSGAVLADTNSNEAFEVRGHSVWYKNAEGEFLAITGLPAKALLKGDATRDIAAESEPIRREVGRFLCTYDSKNYDSTVLQRAILEIKGWTDDDFWYICTMPLSYRTR